MSVVLMPKQYLPEGAREHETPEQASARLHIKKNRPANPAEDMEFPAWRPNRPYPRAIYRQWDADERENEVYRVAGKHALNLEKRQDRFAADQLVGQYETRNVGVTDFVAHDQQDEVISELRERNDREFATLLEQGWSETPDGVKSATRKLQMRVATAAAERQYEDRHLSEQGARELEAIDGAADDHVVNVPETRKQLQAEGKLPKEKK